MSAQYADKACSMERGEQPYPEVGETNKGINRRYCLVTVLLYFLRQSSRRFWSSALLRRLIGTCEAPDL